MPRHTHPERVWKERQRLRRLKRGPVITRRKARKRNRQRSCDTGKRRYRDQSEAIGSIHVFQVHSQRQTIPVRAYECEWCQGWHTTSWSTRDG